MIMHPFYKSTSCSYQMLNGEHFRFDIDSKYSYYFYRARMIEGWGDNV